MHIVSVYPVGEVLFVATSISNGSEPMIATFLPINGDSHLTSFKSQDVIGQFASYVRKNFDIENYFEPS